jgi:hypothetical protein
MHPHTAAGMECTMLVPADCLLHGQTLQGQQQGLCMLREAAAAVP